MIPPNLRRTVQDEEPGGDSGAAAAGGGGGPGGGGRRRLVAQRGVGHVPQPWLPVLGLARPGSSFRWLNACPVR